MWHIWGRTEMHTWFLLEKHEGKTPLVGAKHDGVIKLKYILRNYGCRV
jgi:hypothetical protein